MRHVFTTREKVLLVILAVLVIAVGYWKLILTPINDSIADLNAQTASEQDAILTNSARLSRMRQMQQELETLLADPDAKPLPDYDNSERLLVELNTILSGTVDYTLSFGSTYLLEDGGSIICRELLAKAGAAPAGGTAAEDRTADYYKKRPCPELCRICADLCAEFIAAHPEGRHGLYKVEE